MPYRTAVVQALRELADFPCEVVSDPQTGALSSQARLALIEECDLFIGIYAHEQGALWDADVGDPLVNPVTEFTKATDALMNRLILVAAPEMGELKLLAPVLKPPSIPEPVFEPFERPIEPKAPPDNLTTRLQTWCRKCLKLPTPEDIYQEAHHRYTIEYRIYREKIRQNAVLTTQERRRNTEIAQNRAAHQEALALYKIQTDQHCTFLSKLRTNLPLHTFTSIDSLLLNIQQGIEAWYGGESLRSYTDVLNRWRWWTEYHEGQLRQETLHNRLLLESPAEQEFSQLFLHLWHEKVSSLVQKVVEVSRTLIDEGHFLDEELYTDLEPYANNPLADIQHETYERICSRILVRLPLENVQDLVDRYIAALKKYTHARILQESQVTSIKLWKHSMTELYGFLNDAPYRKCFLLIGRSGSGKTHFVTRLLKRHAKALSVDASTTGTSYVPYYLYISPEDAPPDIESAEQLLLHAARFHLPGREPDLSWRSFTEFAGFFQKALMEGKSEPRLVIVLDDLDVWVQDRQLSLSNLQAFISDHTHLRYVYWVICLSEACYDLMTSNPKFEHFWRDYGFSEFLRTSAPTGWIGLDTLNKEAKVWRKILEHQGIPVRVVAELDTMSQNLLTNPFIAWLVGDLLTSGEIPLPQLLNLNYIQLWRKFWERQIGGFLTRITKDVRSSRPSGLKDDLPSREIAADQMLDDGQRQLWQIIYLIAGQVVANERLVINNTGISPLIYRTLRQTLLSCGPFDSNHALRAVFVDARLNAWQDYLPETHSRRGRVEEVIDYLYHQYSQNHENGLVLFLRVLSEYLDPQDMYHHILAELADELTRSQLASYTPTSPLRVPERSNIIIRRSSLAEEIVQAKGNVELSLEAVKYAVGKFIEMNLLCNITGPELPSIYGPLLRLDVLPLWQWQSGRYLGEQFRTQLMQLPITSQGSVSDDLTNWMQRYFTAGMNQAYMQGVLEFLILVLDSRDNTDDDIEWQLCDGTALLTGAIFDLPRLYHPVVWLAASKATPVYQYELASWLQAQPPMALEEPDDLQKYLYFLKYAELPRSDHEGVALSTRVKLLQPYYDAIQAYGYGEYFSSFLESMVENAQKGEDLARAFAHLRGIEDHLGEGTYWGNAGSLARWTYDGLCRLALRLEQETSSDRHGEDKFAGVTSENLPWVSYEHLLATRTSAEPVLDTVQAWILHFAEEISTLNLESREYQNYEDDVKKSKKSRHWVLMIRAHCDHLLRSGGLTRARLDWMVDTGWFRWAEQDSFVLNKVVEQAMEEQFTAACGEWFRYSTSPERQRYIDAVQYWAEAAHSEKKCVAMFLIYQTNPNELSDRNRRVNQQLWEIFERLEEDSDPNLRRYMNYQSIQQWSQKQRDLRTDIR